MQTAPARLTISFHSSDLADYMEGLNYNQILIALECAINTIVSLTVNDPNTIGYNQIEEEIRNNAIVQLEMNGDPMMANLIGYEDIYDNIVEKLATDITDDGENVELQVLRDEMVLAKWAKVLNHIYMTPQDVLRLQVEFDYTGEVNGAVDKDKAVLQSWGIVQ